MKCLFLMSALLTMPLAQAQEAQVPPSNESLRAENHYSITAGLGARSPGFGEFSLNGSYLLNGQSMLTLSLATIQGSIEEKADGEVDGRDLYFVGVRTEVKASALSLSYKQFITDSFYADGGLEWLKAEGEFTISKDILGTEDNTTSDLGTYTRLSAMVQIGNQWQWQSFTLGTSWVGMLVPLVRNEDFTDARFFDRTPNSAKKFEEGAKEVQASLLRFYLGWSF